MLPYRITLFNPAVCLCFVRPIVADDSVTAQIRAVFSDDIQYLDRVTPGEAWGETWGFKGAKIGKHAKAEFFRDQPDKGYRLERAVDLPNPVAPVQIFVSNNGNLITLDNWH